MKLNSELSLEVISNVPGPPPLAHFNQWVRRADHPRSVIKIPYDVAILKDQAHSVPNSKTNFATTST